MCLTTTFEKGFIAPHDIIVYKKLDQQEDSSWKTPCQECKVSLDAELVPDRITPELIRRRHHFELHGGVIHAYTQAENSEDYFKTIIPRGTRFWVQDDLHEVAAEKLYITSEKSKEGDKTDLSFLYENSLDLLLKNGKRVKWSPDLNLEDVKGIFAYESQPIGLEIYDSEFSSRKPQGLPNRVSNIEEAEKDFTGKERTQILREKYPQAEILKNLPKDSYIPACGELTKALENFLLINITRKALGLEIIEYKCFWSSTPFEDFSGWYVRPDWRDWTGWCYYYWLRDRVLYFLGSPQINKAGLEGQRWYERISWIKNIYRFFRSI